MQNGSGTNMCEIMQARNGGSLQKIDHIKAFRQFTLPYHIDKNVLL